jgi:hypothetical protein
LRPIRNGGGRWEQIVAAGTFVSCSDRPSRISLVRAFGWSPVMTMDRRNLVAVGLGAAVTGIAQRVLAAPPQTPVGLGTPAYGPGPHAEPFSQVEIVRAASGFFGVAAQTMAGVIEHVFKDNGLPTGYIAGTEVAGAVVVGLRYGKGELYMKHRRRERVFWQGPSAGFDFGGNGSRVFTLIYGIERPEQIFHRFPGVEGTFYFVAGFGVNYQQGDGLKLAPIRAGVGGRAGANVGYLDYSRKRHISPF